MPNPAIVTRLICQHLLRTHRVHLRLTDLSKHHLSPLNSNNTHRGANYGSERCIKYTRMICVWLATCRGAFTSYITLKKRQGVYSLANISLNDMWHRTIRRKNLIQKRILRYSGNICYHSVPNVLFSGLICKYLYTVI
jgi:hypothetical protein